MRLAIAVALQIALLGWAVGERLLPRVNGDEVRIRVQPVDPIDPFRGAYVDLDYGYRSDVREGRVYIPLGPENQLGAGMKTKPSGRFLRCETDGYEVRCGIESFFASQEEARRLERALADGAIARVKVDGAGRAAIVGLD